MLLIASFMFIRISVSVGFGTEIDLLLVRLYQVEPFWVLGYWICEGFLQSRWSWINLQEDSMALPKD